MQMQSRTKKAVAAGALVLAGFGAGAAVAVTGAASAATDDPSSGPGGTAAPDPSHSVGPDETLLTGATAEKVAAAAKARYPGATIQRVETDSEGVYEAHVVTRDGSPVIVQVGKDFAVTGTQSGHGGPGGHDGRGGHGNPGDRDGDADSAAATEGSGA
jgi:hypothetical protein